MKHSYLALLFFVMPGGLSAMDGCEIPSRREILEKNMLARHSLRVDRKTALEAARAAKAQESNKEKSVKFNWLSEITGALALALVLGAME